MASNGQLPTGVTTVVDPAAALIASELGAQTALLRAIRQAVSSGLVEIAALDRPPDQPAMIDFPGPGSLRILVRRTGNGSDSFAVPTTGVKLFHPNEARLGGSLVNSGSNAVILYLADAMRAGVPAIWLAASGGSWDFRLGNVLWCGHVFAVAQTGSTTIVGGEV